MCIRETYTIFQGYSIKLSELREIYKKRFEFPAGFRDIWVLFKNNCYRGEAALRSPAAYVHLLKRCADRKTDLWVSEAVYRAGS